MNLFEKLDQALSQSGATPDKQVGAEQSEQGGGTQGNKQIEWVVRFIREKIQDYTAQQIIKLAESDNKLLMTHLKKPSPQTAKQIGSLIASGIVRQAAIEGASEFGIAANLAVRTVMKFGGGTIINSVTSQVSEWVSEKLMPGSIPDEISGKSQLLRSFDLPDGIADKLDEDQRAHLMLILNILRNKPALFKTQWDILNSVSNVKANPAGGSAAQTGALRTHKSLPSTAATYS